MNKQIIDGCTAATHVAFALSDVATIYPITPIASMGDTAEKWGNQGRRNYMGVPLRVEELEGELGAAGATHGALASGSLATTFTNSQGLMLMISNMFKMAGNRLPAVFHVGTRSLATHALSIFGDHSDIMAVRATGFAFLGSATVQETMDLALVAHLAAVDGLMPVCHFFDGWRTSNQMASVDVIPYEQIFSLIEWDKVELFRSRALNPEHPTVRGSAQNPDVYFQNAEAVNPAYDAFPSIVQRQMDRVARVIGRQYHLFDYVGPDDPEVVLVSMGSSCEVIEQTLADLNSRGYKAGQVKVRLFRPFSSRDLLAAIPALAHTVVTLDRTKESGADGEPLFKDVATALMVSGRGSTRIIGGRYGLSSKNFNPAMVKAIVDEALKPEPKRFFTVGINDDVTNLSLPVDPDYHLPHGTMHQSVHYGMGSDGMVGAVKQAAKIIGSADGLYAQAFFSYSAKKSGGYTISELRVDSAPIREEFSIEQADYVSCAKDTYVERFRMIDRLREGGTFVLNCSWSDAEMPVRLPAAMRRELASKKINFYAVDAQKIALSVGLGVRVNTVMETIFLKFADMVDFDNALASLKQEITQTYLHEGQKEVNANLAAIDAALGALRKVDVPATWADAADLKPIQKVKYIPQRTKLMDTRQFFDQISMPCLRLEGDSLPVSAFSPDGAMPMGTTAFEKRRIAIDVPLWDPAKCVQCTECSFVCPHAAIRPFLFSKDELAQAPANLSTLENHGPKSLDAFRFRIQVYTADCEGCGNCVSICPGHALSMQPIETQLATQMPLERYCEEHVAWKPGYVPRFTINGSQFHQPLMEFSGACAGCGETPYVKLVTQLFGERLIVANATGCSSVWGVDYPDNAYCARKADGRGPAWGNSLFEDNAEYGYGIAVGCRQRRDALAQAMQTALASKSAAVTPEIASAMKAWLDARSEPEASRLTGQALVALLKAVPQADRLPQFDSILNNADMLGKPSVWSFGGDGWAYDIGFAGLDHVLASGEDINILVLDTECYSNTGGQTSKATPLGCVAKYSSAGKRTFKKDLGRMMMTYGTVYVASIALGANYQQAIDALREAEAYPGPSIVICYCPCIAHGIKAGMGCTIIEERRAVEAGYWPLYRFNPMLAAQRLSPFIADDVDSRNDVDSAMETADKNAAGEDPWVVVNNETRTLTVDYPQQAAPSAGATPANQPAAKPSAGSVCGLVTSPAAQQAVAALFPAEKLFDYLDGENRYADISLVVAPATATRLRTELSQRTRLVHLILQGLTHVL